MKHLEGLGQLPSTPKAAGSRVISTYEKAIFHSDLTQEERQEIATSYLDYVLENALSISQIKTVENKLLDSGLLVDVVAETGLPTSSLGKRQRLNWAAIPECSYSLIT
jgi:hypothetical protein